MKKVFSLLIFVVLIAMVGIQFFPTNRNQSDIILDTDLTKMYDVPDNIYQLLKTACYDCHSNNTNYPWYNKLQPISWILEHHVNEGKEELNFSEFGAMSSRRKRNKLKSIISQIEKEKMPLTSYTLIHNDAKLSDKDKQSIINWIASLSTN